jgi:zeta-carotene desaturase
MLAITAGLPPETEENFLSWLGRHGQTTRAIERFWKVVLVSALNEDLDRMSVHYAAQVFRESFLKSPGAGRMGIPSVPLTELYGSGAEYIRLRGGEVLLRAPVESFRPGPDAVCLGVAGREVRADFAVLAVPFDALARLLPETGEAQPLRQQLARFETSPITGIHLWFDRQITELEHAVLLDRTLQWMFHKSKLVPRAASNQGSYVELVVSSSRALVEKPKNEIEEMALRELREFFPGAREAKLVKSTVIKEVHATYSALPRSDDYRPGTATAWPRAFLAGDWTASGWPATMEGAVRSGYRAAEALARSARRPATFLLPDLAATGFMRLFKK